MMASMLLLAIAGPSGSGKSTIADELRADWSVGSMEIVGVDRYYRDLSHLPLSEREQQNFDNPDALESGLLFDHIDALANGDDVDLPRYDFASHVREPGVDPLKPPSVLIVEGLFSLYWEQLRSRADLCVFVDVDSSICLERRLRRDAAERSRDASSVIQQFHSHVAPMCEQFITPTRAWAHVTVSGLAPLHQSVEIIKSQLLERTQLP